MLATRSVAFHVLPEPRGVQKIGGLLAKASIFLAALAARRPFFYHPSPAMPLTRPEVAPRPRHPPVFQFPAGRLPGCLHFLDVGDAQRCLPSYPNGARRLENGQPFCRNVSFLSTLGRKASRFLAPSRRDTETPSLPSCVLRGGKLQDGQCQFLVAESLGKVAPLPTRAGIEVLRHEPQIRRVFEADPHQLLGPVTT